jgi:hypothetical protein
MGITPSGRPVLFKADQNNLALTLHFNAQNQPLLWDIYVEDSHPEKESQAVTTRFQKYALSYHSIQDETKAPVLGGDKLFIGRYKLQHSSLPELIEPPLPYCLSNFRYPSAWWNEWTRPIREALMQYNEKNLNGIATAILADIAYNYPHWPLRHLYAECARFNWFMTMEESSLSFLTENALVEMQEFHTPISSWKALGPEESPFHLPMRIAGLLNGNGGPKEWTILYTHHYTQTNRIVMINRKDDIPYDYKIRFEQICPAKETLIIDGVIEIFVNAQEEINLLNEKRWYYILEKVRASNKSLTLTIPETCPGKFSIYFKKSA